MVALVAIARPLPERLAGIGVLALAMAWSVGVALANWEQIRAAPMPLGSALLVTTVGSMLTVVGIWFGTGAVTWAMGRLLGGKAGFVRVLFAVSAATPPLWIAAPALVFALAGKSSSAPLAGLAIIGPVAAVGFLMLLVAALAAVEGFSRGRAWCCAALTVLFCASYLSLH